MKRWKKGVLIGLFSSLLFDQQAVEAAVGVASLEPIAKAPVTPLLAVTYPLGNRMTVINRSYRLKVPTQVALVADLQALDHANEVNHAPPGVMESRDVESEHVLFAQKAEEADSPVMSSVLHPMQLASRGDFPTPPADGNGQPGILETPVQSSAIESSTIQQEQTSSIHMQSIQVQSTQMQPPGYTASTSTSTSTSNAAPTLMSRAGVTATLGSRIVAMAKQYLGDPYCYGGTTPSGFDCSGFTQYVFQQAGIRLPRTTYAQINLGVQIDRQNLQPGDLLFFSCNGQPTSHSGIYIGNGQFIHADLTRGIAIADLSNPYWVQVYQTAVRVQ